MQMQTKISPTTSTMTTANAAAQLPIPAMFSDSTCTTNMLCQPPNDFPSHLFAHAVIDLDTGEAMEYHDLITNPKTRPTWTSSATNEFGCLTQGVGGCVMGTNTICFINYKHIPPD